MIELLNDCKNYGLEYKYKYKHEYEVWAWPRHLYCCSDYMTVITAMIVMTAIA